MRSADLCAAQHRLWWGAFVLFLAVTVALWVIDQPLRHDSLAKQGIVSFEFCGWQPAAQGCAAMLNAWGARGRDFALLSLGLDYLYMPLYAVVLGLGAHLLLRPLQEGAGASKPWLLAWLTSARWAACLAPLLDAVENVGLIQTVLAHPTGAADGQSAQWAQWAYWAALCAALKFASIGYALLACLLAAMLRKPASKAL
jgi:hypothetical protein